MTQYHIKQDNDNCKLCRIYEIPKDSPHFTHALIPLHASHDCSEGACVSSHGTSTQNVHKIQQDQILKGKV